MENKEILKNFDSIFSAALNQVKEDEKALHADDNRIFYPDPCEENTCALCGKTKEQHAVGYDSKPFFCKSKEERKWKHQDELYKDAFKLILQKTTS